ncbi:4-hydroxy-3-methylbut-2-en-1-yl diphosphate synthase, partial [bacterium]
GDTLRVSLTGDSCDEIQIGWDMLSGLELRRRGPNVISCPSCGRCDIDVVPLAEQVNLAVKGISAPVSIAVMGCEVNGPGEAKSADYGIAGGDGFSLIFKKGERVARVTPDVQLKALMDVITEDLAKQPAAVSEE